MTLRPQSKAGCIVVALALVGVMLAASAGSRWSAAGAAVRSCKPIVASDIATDGSELGARKKALDQWKAKAGALGKGYDSWRLAASKSLKCFKRPVGDFECVAFGAPCIIAQNPQRVPRATPGSPHGARDVGI
ncbi:MAG: hypothetical protein ACRCS9_02665 [Hyphomicrobium sp.]